jgi:hypothetical protein
MGHHEGSTINCFIKKKLIQEQKSLIIYPWRLRMLLIIKKKFKTALKQLLYTYSFYSIHYYDRCLLQHIMKNVHTSSILMYLHLCLTIPISKGFIPKDPWNVNNQ